MVQEMKEAFSSYFVTLTYNDTFLNYGEKEAIGNVQDHKDFIKWLKYFEDPRRLEEREDISIDELVRLKNAVKEDKKLKYYSVLEYGDAGGRPHWHYILFNVHDIRNINSAWSEIVHITEDSGKKHYLPGRSKGKIDVDECNVNTIDYVLKYMIKTPSERSEREVPEKSFMSKGLGLGIADKQFVDYIKTEKGNLVVNSRGTKISLPRYYNKKFLTDTEREVKSNYIRTQIEYEKGKRDALLMRHGIQPGEVDLKEKIARFDYLKNRSRREIKNYEEGSSKSG